MWLIVGQDEPRINQSISLIEKNISKLSFEQRNQIDSYLNNLLFVMFLWRHQTFSDEQIDEALKGYPSDFQKATSETLIKYWQIDPMIKVVE